MDYYGWKPYVSAAARRHQAARAVARLTKKGRTLSPVAIDGRAIARTFWGKAWCDNLERYSDFANRLPRGRTYVRNGSVVDLQIAPGAVTALVSGSALYDVKVAVKAVPKTRWGAVCTDCAGEIDSLIELLQGRLSQGVMARICQEKTGLFPSPAEISFTCSCPDWASMCKHVAAVLYGIGARLDAQPDLLFALRKVDQQDLIADGGESLPASRKKQAAGKVLDTGDLSAIFGIDIAPLTPPAIRQTPKAAVRPGAAEGGKATAGKPSVAKPSVVRPKRAAAAKPAVRKKPSASAKATADKSASAKASLDKSASGEAMADRALRTGAMSAGERASVAKRMKEYWAATRIWPRKD